MTEKPTQEQIKRFWEECGFQMIRDNKRIIRQVIFPDNQQHCRLPTLNLNNLSKYAVPKLYELGWEYCLKGYTYHTVDLYKNERQVSSKGMKDPALALFWAIYKAFDLEVK